MANEVVLKGQDFSKLKAGHLFKDKYTGYIYMLVAIDGQRRLVDLAKGEVRCVGDYKDYTIVKIEEKTTTRFLGHRGIVIE